MRNYTYVLFCFSLGILLFNSCKKTEVKGGTKTESAFIFSYNNDEVILCMDATSDGGFVLAAVEHTKRNANTSAVIFKTDARGNTLWRKTCGSTGKNVLTSVHPTTDGGYIACGKTTYKGNALINNNNYADAWIVKLDKDGNLEWDTTYGGNYEDVFFSIVQVQDDSYITGYNEIPPNDTAQMKSVFMKIDSKGRLVWQVTALDGTYTMSVLDNPYNGNYLFVYTDIANYIYYTEYSPDGSKIYESSFRSGTIDEMAELSYIISYPLLKAIVTPDGYVFGHTLFLASDSAYSYAVISKTKGFRPVLDFSREFRWHTLNRLCDIKVDRDGGYIFTGSSSGLDSKSIAGAVNHNMAYIKKTDNNGKEIWANTYETTNNSNYGWGVMPVQDGGYLMAGSTAFYSTGGTKTFFLRTGEKGEIK